MPKSQSPLSYSPFSSLSLYGPMPGEGLDRGRRMRRLVSVIRTVRGRVRGIERMLAGLVWTTAFAAAYQWDRWCRFREHHVYTPAPESGKWPRCIGESRPLPDLRPRNVCTPDSSTRRDPTQPHHGGPLRYTWDGPRWHGAPGSESSHWKVTASPATSTLAAGQPGSCSTYQADAATSTRHTTSSRGCTSTVPRAGDRGRQRHTRRSWNTWGI